MAKREGRKDPAYLREQGNAKARIAQKRKITFCLSKHLPTQGQTFDDWEKEGLLATLMERLKFVGQFSDVECRQNKYIKEYTKVDFPPDSGFKRPTHIEAVTWAVMHITTNSKEVVVGYIEEGVFYIIFLDKEHQFWPSQLKNT